VDHWQWFDLSKLGEVASVKFTLSSSDVGQWGMNTPAYFCLDKLFAGKATSSFDSVKKGHFRVFPTSTTREVTVVLAQPEPVRVFDLYGNLLQTITPQQPEVPVDLSAYPAAVYFIRVGNEVVKVVKL
jgi:hypothetical protein